MLKVLKMECLKMKGTKIFLMATFFPMLSLVQGVGYVQSMKDKAETPDLWGILFTQGTFLYGLLILPVLIILTMAMMTQMENSHNGWKQLLAFPIERKNIYLAKLLIGCGIILYSITVLVIGIMISGIVLGVKGPIPYDLILSKPILVFIASLPMIACQFYLSVRFRHIGIPLGIGTAFTLPIILVANSAKYWVFYPWTYPLLSILPDFVTSGTDEVIQHSIMYGISTISFMIIIGLGLLQFRKKDII